MSAASLPAGGVNLFTGQAGGSRQVASSVSSKWRRYIALLESRRWEAWLPVIQGAIYQGSILHLAEPTTRIQEQNLFHLHLVAAMCFRSLERT